MIARVLVDDGIEEWINDSQSRRRTATASAVAPTSLQFFADTLLKAVYPGIQGLPTDLQAVGHFLDRLTFVQPQESLGTAAFTTAGSMAEEELKLWAFSGKKDEGFHWSTR